MLRASFLSLWLQSIMRPSGFAELLLEDMDSAVQRVEEIATTLAQPERLRILGEPLGLQMRF